MADGFASVRHAGGARGAGRVQTLGAAAGVQLVLQAVQRGRALVVLLASCAGRRRAGRTGGRLRRRAARVRERVRWGQARPGRRGAHGRRWRLRSARERREALARCHAQRRLQRRDLHKQTAVITRNLGPNILLISF